LLYLQWKKYAISIHILRVMTGLTVVSCSFDVEGCEIYNVCIAIFMFYNKTPVNVLGWHSVEFN